MAAQGATANLDEVWANARVIFGRLLRDVSGGLSEADHMACFSLLFNYLCPAGDGEALYLRVADLFREVVADLVKDALPLPDEQLVVMFRVRWTEFTSAVKVVNSLLAYLNRTWIKVQRSNAAEVFEIKVLAEVSWRDSMFMPLKERLTGALLNMIEADRNGEQIDDLLISETAQCYVKLGLNKDDPKDNTLDIYRDHFEKQFLEATRVYYGREAQAFLEANGVSEYMKKAVARFEEEMNRVHRYLHASTEKPLVAELEAVLVKDHKDEMHEKFTTFLDEDKVEDMRRMYGLLSRIQDAGLEPMRQAFEKHIVAFGRAAIESQIEEMMGKPDVFVSALLRVFRKFSELIKVAFDGNTSFSAAQDRAFHVLVNENALTARTKGGKEKVATAPQYLAKYCDMILRKGANHVSAEDEMERVQNDVVSLFKYLPDKDVFMMVYQKLLSNRLIKDLSANDDFEASLIAKLKGAQGFEYCSKLQRMIQDMATSKDINASFKEYTETKSITLPIDFTIYVLGQGGWPLAPHASNYTLPQELASTVTHFRSFYDQKYNGRKLTYLHHLCKGEVAVLYVMKGRLRVSVSGFQLAILLHFNHVAGDAVTLGELAKATQLKDDALKIALLGFLKIKLLTCAAGDEHASWTDATSFGIARSFQSKKARINANVAVDVSGLKSAAVAGVESSEVRQEREMKLQAAIVRTMKARKQANFNELVAEATAQTQRFFKPDVSLIKKAIETLLEKQYIERQVDDQGRATKHFNYIS